MTYAPLPVFEVLGGRDDLNFFFADNTDITHGNTRYRPEYKDIKFADRALRSRSQGPREIVDCDQINRVFQQICEVAGPIWQCSVIELGSLVTVQPTRPTSLKGQGHRRSISGFRGHLVFQKLLGRLI